MLPVWIYFKEALSVKQAGQCPSVVLSWTHGPSLHWRMKYSVLEGQVAHRAVFEKVIGAVQAGNLQTNTAVSAVALDWVRSCFLQLF